MIGSILAIGFLSFIVWGHHMFITGMNPFLGSVFVFTTLLIAIPSAVKVFNYLTTLWRGSLVLTPAMLFAIGLVSTFITGGVTGIILADSALDIAIHDTYFVVAHFHIVMGMSAVFGMFGGVYHWFPKMYGRMMNTRLGYAHFWITIIGAYGVFFPMHFVGLAGAPRRYYDYSVYNEFNENSFDMIMDLNLIVTGFAIFAALGQLLFLFNFFYSIFRGPKAPQNPWNSNTLEWTTPVEHVHGNWPGALPVVHRWPYDYSKPGAETDFIPQTVPLAEGEHMLGGDMEGMKIVVDATGTVVEVIEANPEVEVETEIEAEAEVEKVNEEQATAKLLKDFIAKQDKKFAELEKVNKANQKTILTMAAHIEKMGVEKKKFTRTETAPLDKVSKLA
jgi:cytochrome c oxidase subunit 1